MKNNIAQILVMLFITALLIVIPPSPVQSNHGTMHSIFNNSPKVDLITKNIPPQVQKRIRDSYTRYEKVTYSLLAKILSPVGLRVITSLFLIASMVALIKTKNPTVYLPLIALAWLFAYLGHLIRKILFGG